MFDTTKGGVQSIALYHAAITQLVECLAVNQNVTGSNPVGGASRQRGYSLARLERPAHNREAMGSNPLTPI